MARKPRYEIQAARWLKTYEGKGPVDIGRIIDLDRSGEPVAYIVYESHSLSQSPYRIYGKYLNTNIGEIFAIMVDDNYKRLFCEKPERFKAIALHELGHHVCGHYNEEFLKQHFHEKLSQKEMTERLRRERALCAEQGSVMTTELEADAFACREVGKHAMNMMFDLLIEERRKRADKGAELAIKEFKLRKKAIRNLR